MKVTLQPSGAVLEVETGERILEAAKDYRSAECEQALTLAIAMMPPQRLVSDVLQPLLREVGERWHRGEFAISQERLVSTIVRRHVGLMLDTYDRTARHQAIVFATLPGTLAGAPAVGLIARAADAAAIHYRLLNRSKGAAVQGPRSQIDRRLYREAMKDCTAARRRLMSRLIPSSPSALTIKSRERRMSLICQPRTWSSCDRFSPTRRLLAAGRAYSTASTGMAVRSRLQHSAAAVLWGSFITFL